eukprot:scaffold139040_cov19-Tisochrysis_lutea.AAC.2
MRLVTPGVGALTLSKAQEPELFNLAKVGLGALGVVSQTRGKAIRGKGTGTWLSSCPEKWPTDANGHIPLN